MGLVMAPTMVVRRVCHDSGRLVAIYFQDVDMLRKAEDQKSETMAQAGVLASAVRHFLRGIHNGPTKNER